MGISIFPSTAAEFVSNNFIVDMNDTTNNTADTGGVKQAGPYELSFESGSETTFDIYLISDEGESVGYSNTTTIEASGLFTTVVILGVASDERITFRYAGSINNADGTGDEPGAGAYLTSISPADLPTIDDTATVIGGNFGTLTTIFFDSGTVALEAKNVTVTNGTSLVVTRPDGLDANLDPWDLRAVNTGVTPPTGSDAHILSGTVTAGAVPSWTTTSPLTSGTVNTVYAGATLVATDADGSVTYSITAGSLPTGLSLDGSTGVISGTPTAGGQTFTAAATDDGGNQTTREFTIPIALATGGSVTSAGGFTYHTFTSTDDFVALAEITDAEYLVIAGGGGSSDRSGGGGAGGLLNGTATISAGTVTATIGAGGGEATDGSDSTLAGYATAIGGGFADGGTGSSGGSGGGAAFSGNSGGSGTAGQGNAGGNGVGAFSTWGGGGGGGAGANGGNAGASGSGGNKGGAGGDGLQFSDWATATSTGDSGYYAGGGAGSGQDGITTPGGLGGGGGFSNSSSGQNGDANTGGGAGAADGGQTPSNVSGGSGLIIVRYA